MPDEINAKDVAKKKQVRKSFILAEIPITKKPKVKQSIKSSLTFPTEDYRLMVTKTYKEYGFSTMRAYLMALIDLSIEDEYIKDKVKNKA